MIKPVFKKWWFWLIAVILIMAAVVIVVITKNNDKELETAGPTNEKITETFKPDASAPAAGIETEQKNSLQTTQQPTAGTSEANATPSPATAMGMDANAMYPDGFYKVGEDIPAGEYKLFAFENTMGASYFEVTADDTGEFSDFLASGNFYNFTYITVVEGQYFGFDDTYAVPVAEVTPYDASCGKYIPGMYKVGVDIPAGEYKLVFDSNYGGFYEIYSASTHAPEAIIASGNFTDDIYVTLKDGEYIYFTGAYIKAG